MVLIPTGYFLGANNPHTGGPMTAADIAANNLVFAALGNYTGAAVFVALPYFLLYGRYSAVLNKYTTF
jgi:formate/nitrite transporter FocA (FNT family)